MSCFEEFKHSSSCIPKCNSLYLIFRDGVISFLTIPLHGSWFTSCPEWHILKPSISIRSRDLFNPLISLLELSCVTFHLKPSLRNVANCGVYQWSKFSPILSAREVFISSLISSKQLFSLVAELLLKFRDVSISPRSSYPFFVDFSTTPFFSVILFRRSIFYSFVPEALWCCSLRPIILFCQDTVIFPFLSV